MSALGSTAADTGLEVVDLFEDTSFAGRRLHERDVAMQMEGMRRLAHAFVERPDTILQELVNAAVEMCGADSSGISIEREKKTDEEFYEWVATAGEYAGFLNATLPRSPSACGTCLERGRPQLFRVAQRFFDLMGIEAPTVTDGILLPWEVEETRGTIWIMAHGRDEAFDGNDLRMMQVLANFAAMGVRQQRQQKLLMEQTIHAAAAGMANELAHRINNPLQSITNLVYLAGAGGAPGDAKTLAEDLAEPVQRLSALAAKLLSLPTAANRPK
ncbi:GAF domain-containing protein [Tunturibacter empetritectus]|uniref:Signal transduction histidine kinase n=1 Tax=Tunturiibacter empetritectus TaxID=3069691 RepID=A0A7W8MR34_9BACT|nr:GAF domain-containing protein [Edaphobacter lichenicola]MBB5315854.1 signal transduction histidine kinase [Edaphobacter lichenicola]